MSLHYSRGLFQTKALQSDGEEADHYPQWKDRHCSQHSPGNGGQRQCSQVRLCLYVRVAHRHCQWKLGWQEWRCCGQGRNVHRSPRYLWFWTFPKGEHFTSAKSEAAHILSYRILLNNLVSITPTKKLQQEVYLAYLGVPGNSWLPSSSTPLDSPNPSSPAVSDSGSGGSCHSSECVYVVEFTSSTLIICRLACVWHHSDVKHVVYLQSCIRHHHTHKELRALKAEVHSMTKFKEISYKLENKVVKLTQTLQKCTEEKKDLQNKVQELEQQLLHWTNHHEEVDVWAKQLQASLQAAESDIMQWDSLLLAKGEIEKRLEEARVMLSAAVINVINITIAQHSAGVYALAPSDHCTSVDGIMQHSVLRQIHKPSANQVRAFILVVNCGTSLLLDAIKQSVLKVNFHSHSLWFLTYYSQEKRVTTWPPKCTIVTADAVALLQKVRVLPERPFEKAAGKSIEPYYSIPGRFSAPLGTPRHPGTTIFGLGHYK